MSLETFHLVALLVCAAILMWDNRSRMATRPRSLRAKALPGRPRTEGSALDS